MRDRTEAERAERDRTEADRAEIERAEKKLGENKERGALFKMRKILISATTRRKEKNK